MKGVEHPCRARKADLVVKGNRGVEGEPRIVQSAGAVHATIRQHRQTPVETAYEPRHIGMADAPCGRYEARWPFWLASRRWNRCDITIF